MKHHVMVSGQKIAYTIKKFSRSKSLRISVARTGQVLITGPKYIPTLLFHSYIKSHAAAIKKQQQKILSAIPFDLRQECTEHFHQHKKDALAFVQSRVAYWNTFYEFSYEKIRVKKLKSRWGSCSSKNNLNFNYKILFLPTHLQDYIIVHELCHLQQLNHSPEFWQLVEQTIPEYKAHKKQLRQL